MSKEIAPTTQSHFVNCFRAHSGKNAFGSRISAGVYKWFTFGEVLTRVENFAAGIAASGIAKKGTLVGLCSRNNLPLIIAEFATLYKAQVSVVMQFDGSIADHAHITQDIGLALVVCSSEVFPGFLKASQLPGSKLKAIVVMDPESMDDSIFSTCSGPTGGPTTACPTYKFSDIEKLGESRKDLKNWETYDSDFSLMTIFHSSGTTGKPMGILVPAHSLLIQAKSMPIIINSSPNILITAFAHGAGKLAVYAHAFSGQSMALFDGNMQDMFTDIQAIKPVSLMFVPRMISVLKSNYQQDIYAGMSENEALEKYREILGGHVEEITVFGAKVPESLPEFCHKLFPNAKVLDLYGITEVGQIFRNDRVLPQVQVKLLDVPEMSYFRTDKPNPRGELAVKTNTMFLGYFHNEAATKEKLDEEGFFHTGDIVEFFGGDHYQIIDRKKNIMKLAQGKFVAPSGIEEIIAESSFVSQCFVYGNIARSYLLAAIIPNWKTVEIWQKNELVQIENLPKPPGSEEWKAFLSNYPSLKRALLEDIKKTCKAKELHEYEIPQNILIELEPLSFENHRLTITGKTVRYMCERFYKEKMEEMYKVDELSSLFRETIGSKLEDGITFSEMGIDSLQAVKLQSAIKKRYDVDVSMEEMFKPNASIQLVNNLIEVGGSSQEISTLKPKSEVKDISESNINWLEECRLPDNFTVPPTSSSMDNLLSLQNKKHVLLTGATGFFGSFLLHELLVTTKPECKIHVLVRAETEQQASERIKKSLEYHMLPWQHEYEQRIVPICGSLSKVGLGIDKKMFSWLTENIEVVYHNGAAVNWKKSYQSLKLENVEATKQLVNFAVTSKLKAFHYVSTIATILGTPDLSEENGEEDTKQLTERLNKINGYGISKWVAEQYVQKARKLGLPATVYRPGMIGSSSSGACNITDWISRLIRGCIVLGVYPSSSESEKFSCIPVDVMAKILIYLSQMPRSLQKNSFHLVNLPQNSIEMDTLLSGAGGQISLTPLPFPKWLNVVREKSQSLNNDDDAVWPLLSLFQNGITETNDNKFSITNLLQGISQSGIVLPKLNTEWVKRIGQFMKNNQLLKKVE